MMLKDIIKKGSNMLAGFMLGMLVVGFAGLVTANNTLSGPNGSPPFGFISPTFDGLTINGNLDVNPGAGENVNMKDVYIDGLEVDRLAGCFGCPSSVARANGSQYLEIVSPVIDMYGTDIEIGSIQLGAEVDINSHVTARSMGYMYEITTSKSLADSYARRGHTASVSCPSTTYLVSCTARLYDYQNDFKYEGNALTNNGRTCYGYARQVEDPASTSTLYVEATCWDPDNSSNKNF